MGVVEMGVEDKLAEARRLIRGMGRAAVALSGGVDSALLAALARDELGDRAVALTVDSPLLAADEREDAARVASELGMEHVLLKLDELEDPELAANPPDRCYLCKRMRFGRAADWAEARGIPWVLDGSNADDRGDYRPGMRALAELPPVRSPLLEAGLTKAEVRAASRKMGLFTWDKPARACLASRIPYGEALTREKLQRVEAAEAYLARLLPRGAQFRVRAHGDLARVEAEGEDMAAIFRARDEVSAKLRAMGFAYATLDLKGYRMGSLNETLNYPAAQNA